ncbi:MAG: hypothetical protein LLG13_08970 [Bacteroidales bacterium]|nr:hypothetical protein [Bacteroidales bacterium]
MKTFSGSLIIILSILLFSGCKGKGSMKKDLQTGNDTITVPDTGYTGIKKYMSGKYIVKEVTFKNGVKEGLMKSFYQDGRVRQTFWYKNDLKEDSSKFYYQEGQLFRTTPYKRDTIDGIQIQYYRTGKLKAKIGYSKGLRTPYLEEFTQEGKMIGNYPGLVVNIKDEYRAKGVYRISLELSDMAMSENVKYYRGDLSKGVFDTAHCKVIKTIKGVGYLDLRKTGSRNTGSVGVIASVLTNFGNRHLIYKKIELPYNDLN